MVLFEGGEEQGKELVVTFWCICKLIPIKNEISKANMAKYHLMVLGTWYIGVLFSVLLFMLKMFHNLKLKKKWPQHSTVSCEAGCLRPCRQLVKWILELCPLNH